MAFKEDKKTYQCCNKSKYVKAYIWFWPFKAKYCLNCKEITGDTGWFLDFIWRFFVWPFWDGRARVITEDDKMKRLHELTPQQIEEWRKARMAEGQKRYGDRDLQRYNLVDVMEELLDCKNILDRFENRLRHDCGDKLTDIALDDPSFSRLVAAINLSIDNLKLFDRIFSDDVCTDENGGDRIWWPGPEGK